MFGAALEAEVTLREELCTFFFLLRVSTLLSFAFTVAEMVSRPSEFMLCSDGTFSRFCLLTFCASTEIAPVSMRSGRAS